MKPQNDLHTLTVKLYTMRCNAQYDVGLCDKEIMELDKERQTLVERKENQQRLAEQINLVFLRSVDSDVKSTVKRLDEVYEDNVAGGLCNCIKLKEKSDNR